MKSQKHILHAFTIIIAFLAIIYGLSYYYGLLDLMSVLAFSLVATAACCLIALNEVVKLDE